MNNNIDKPPIVFPKDGVPDSQTVVGNRHKQTNETNKETKRTNQ